MNARCAFPAVSTDRLYVDACSAMLVRKPWEFDLLVMENMFGDIISDLTAGLIGGMGMAPSADIGDRHAVFQPCHGTAPDIMGKGIANPTAMILSAAMMLDWLADRHGHDGAAQGGRARWSTPSTVPSPRGCGHVNSAATTETAAIAAAVLRELPASQKSIAGRKSGGPMCRASSTIIVDARMVYCFAVFGSAGMRTAGAPGGCSCARHEACPMSLRINGQAGQKW